MKEGRVAPEVVERLSELFQRNGYIRWQNQRRLEKEGSEEYKKGDELRLVAETKAELTEIRRLLQWAGFEAGKAFVKGRQLRQPLYGRETVARFLKMIEGAGSSKGRGEDWQPRPGSHEWRRRRRQVMAEEVKAGKSLTKVAAEFGMTIGHVSLACREFGVQTRGAGRPKGTYGRKDDGTMKVTRARWESTDWTLPNGEIARLYGVSNERVRQVREMLGMEKSKDLPRSLNEAKGPAE